MQGAKAKRKSISLYLFPYPVKTLWKSSFSSCQSVLQLAPFAVHGECTEHLNRSAPHCYLQQHGSMRTQANSSCPYLHMLLHASREEK